MDEEENGTDFYIKLYFRAARLAVFFTGKFFLAFLSVSTILGSEGRRVCPEIRQHTQDTYEAPFVTVNNYMYKTRNQLEHPAKTHTKFRRELRPTVTFTIQRLTGCKCKT